MPCCRTSISLFLTFFVSYSSAIVDFEKEVWPILMERCIECHKAPYEQSGRLKDPKAGLRLDGAAHILHGSNDGPVVVVDHPSRSSLYLRVVLPVDDDDHMPPKGNPLSLKDRETIRKWIAQGADFGKWVGATDGIDELANKRKQNEVHVPAHIEFYDFLSKNLSLPPVGLLKETSEKTGLLIRPLGIGSPLVEVRKVSSEIEIHDQVLKDLLPLSDHLAKLDLTGAKISDEACSTISQFRRLTSLNLRGTEVGDQGLKHLVGMKYLQNLNLCETKVSDYGIHPLLGFEKLENLHLWKSKVTETRVDFLKQRLVGVNITH